MQQPPPQGGPQYGVPPPDMPPFTSSSSAPSRPMQLHIEAASPINSRPPPTQPTFEELLPGGSSGNLNFPDDLGGDETDRGGASGNRWPRQETLALLKIRSEMDATFRDATLKGPLWEEVSRKLAELGYRRSAKKCKEKFENVHKYYKRTKENRTGRPDGKTYRFFSQLEALHSASPSPTTPSQSSVPTLGLPPVPTQVQPVQFAAVSSSPATIGFSVTMAGSSAHRVTPVSNPLEASQQPVLQGAVPHHGISGFSTPAGISFSSNTESSESDESDDEDTEEIGGSQEQGKRKRRSRSGGGGGGGSSKKIMQFFEGIMKQVMERQEAMQQKFLETIEKREQDRMIREEAWRRQEMARLSREQEILAQERSMAASRDAAVISFIQKMTGQNIPLPTIPAPVITVIPPPPPPSQPQPQPQPQQHHPVTTTPPPPHPHPPPQRSHSQPSPKTPQPQQPPPQPPPTQQQPPPQQQQPPHQQHQQCTDIVVRPTSTEIVLTGHEHSRDGGFEPGSSSTSSRWPKTEVHALIKIRSDMDSRYQEAGPKGPLWEEISNGMRRLGYNRSSKRCKEKWENINKYFKKVKESNKKRPEDSKTCPYFHQLDALYRNKYSTGTGTGGTSAGSFDASTYHNSQDSAVVTAPTTPQGPPQPISQQPPAVESHNKIGNGGNDSGNNASTKQNGTGTRTGTEGGNRVRTGGVQIPTSNGGSTGGIQLYRESAGTMGLKKPEDIMKDLMERRQHPESNNYDKFDEGDDDSMEDDDEFDDDEDEDDEDGNGGDRSNQYKIQFQRPNVNVSGTGGTNQPTSTAPGTTAGGNSFLAMVQ